MDTFTNAYRNIKRRHNHKSTVFEKKKIKKFYNRGLKKISFLFNGNGHRLDSTETVYRNEVSVV